MDCDEELMRRSEEDVYLAIMDKIGVKVIQGFEHDDNDTTWAE